MLRLDFSPAVLAWHIHAVSDSPPIKASGTLLASQAKAGILVVRVYRLPVGPILKAEA